jgi:phage terminase small subunit
MTRKQERFVAEYLTDLNATQAAIRAGYGAKNANVVGPRLLANVGIAAAIAAGKAQQLASLGLSAERVLDELRRLAFSDVRHLFDAQGRLKPVTALAPDDAAAIASVEVVIKNAAAGDQHTDTIHKIKYWDKVRSLEMLAKHFALLTEKVEHSGGVDIVWRTSE